MPEERNPFHTKFCEMFDLEYPIVAFTHCPDTVYEVCNAGGIGVLGITTGLRQSAPSQTPADEVDAALKLIKSKTSRPFGVDMLLPGAVPAGIDEVNIDEVVKMIPDEHKQFMDRIGEEAGIPEAMRPDQMKELFRALGTKAIGDVLEVVFDHKVPVFAAALGSPPETVEMLHKEGMKVISLIGRVGHVRKVIDAGADIIVAQGYDAGGHTGEIGTFSLVPQVVDEVKRLAPEMPVLAAGGIMDGRGFSAALALGADGIWTGTIWQVSLEHDTLMPMKQKILNASQDDSLRQKFVTGKSCRVINNRFVEAWQQPGAPQPLPMPFQTMLGLPFMNLSQIAEKWDWATAVGGQGVGLVKSLRSCRQIVMDYVDGALDVMEKFQF